MTEDIIEHACDVVWEDAVYGSSEILNDLISVAITASYSGWHKSETDKLDALLEEIINEH